MKDNHFQYSPSVWLVPTFFVLFLWTVFFVENAFHLNLTQHGIYPRKILGLQGVIFSPFIHSNFGHLANNSIPLFVLTMALIYFYRDISLKILFYGILCSGFLTWLIGRPSYHIGASGLIYVLVSFIFFKGLFTKYYRLVALSLAVIIVYGGMIWYVFPKVDETISWEGHLAGLVTGLLFSIIYKTPEYKELAKYDWQKPDFDPENDAFMKHFDENGNFVEAPKPEAIVDELPIEIRYDYKEN